MELPIPSGVHYNGRPGFVAERQGAKYLIAFSGDITEDLWVSVDDPALVRC